MLARLSAEFLGTFWLVLGGCGSAVLAAAFPDVGIGLHGVSLAATNGDGVAESVGLAQLRLRHVRTSEILIENFDQPGIVLAGSVNQVLDSETVLKDLVREADGKYDGATPMRLAGLSAAAGAGPPSRGPAR